MQVVGIPHRARRDGRVVEGGGLLNRCTVKSRTEGSNPSLSAIPFTFQPRASPVDCKRF